MSNQAGWEWAAFEEQQYIEEQIDADSEIEWRLQQLEILESQGAE